MRIPEVFFAIINPAMRLLLHSPLHRLMSRSLMLITFTGRRSGRRYTTPVRYLRIGTTIKCFTSQEGQWWKNLRGGADVILRLEGINKPYHAVALWDDPALIKAALREYLELFPQDAAYHEIRRSRNGSLNTDDLDRASNNAVVVEATPIAPEPS